MTLLPAVALVAILVFVHEFGHFIVAKLCGVHCTVLSIGYGKRLVGYDGVAQIIAFRCFHLVGMF